MPITIIRNFSVISYRIPPCSRNKDINKIEWFQKYIVLKAKKRSPHSCPLHIHQLHFRMMGWREEASLAALQNRCSKSQKFTSPYRVISKEVITTLPSLNSKETKRVFIFAMHFISSLAQSQTFLECQVWAWHCTMLCLPGVPTWNTWAPGVGSLTVHPLWFFFFF